MDITEALEAALVEVKAAIPDAQAEAEKAARHVSALLDEERGLQLALARRSTPSGVNAVAATATGTAGDATVTTITTGADTPPPTDPLSRGPAVPEGASAESHGDWASLNHMDAVLRALSEANRPLSPQDIVRALRAVGRSDSNDQVRAALAALKRRGRVSLMGRAQWVATAANLSRIDEAQIFQPPGTNGLASIPMDESEPAKV
jgi:hypothetical protein